MTIFCNYNIPTFPMTFGALTMGAGGCSVPVGNIFTPSFTPCYGSMCTNPFGGFNMFNNYTMPSFNFKNTSWNWNNTSSSSGWTMPWSGWLNNWSFNTPQLSMPTFDFSNIKFNFNTQSSSSYTSSSSQTRSSSGDTFTRSYTGTLPQQLVQRAESYVGKVNSSAEGNRIFSNGKSQKWCADFVTKVTKDTYGSKLPSSFGSSSVSELRTWAQNNNCYMQTDNKSSTDKKDFVAKNVKPGDIMIEKRGGKSHTGIITKVYSDGSFDTVEGNTSNKVANRHYTANSNTLSGFIHLDKYAQA